MQKQCLSCYYFRFVGFERYCAHSEHVKILIDPKRRCIDWIAFDDKFIIPDKADKIPLETMLNDYRR